MGWRGLRVRPINDLMDAQAMHRALADIEEGRIRDLVSRSGPDTDSEDGMEDGYPVHIMTDPSRSPSMEAPGLLSDPSSPEKMDTSHHSSPYTGRQYYKTYCPPWGLNYRRAPPESDSGNEDDPDPPDSGNEGDMDSLNSNDLPNPVPAEVITLTSSPFNYQFSPEYRPTYQYPSPSYSPTSPQRTGSPDFSGLQYEQVSISTPLKLISCYESEDEFSTDM